MEFLIYFAVGVLVTFVGAIPLGTVNISVINTTLRVDARNAMKIALTAGIAEIIISFYALHCSMVVGEFIDMNQWIQVMIAILLFLIGAFLFFKKKKEAQEKKFKMSKYITGFFLGLLNPTVLVYWIFMITYLNKNAFQLDMNTSLKILFVFFAGVYLGKLLTLYAYSKFSILIKNKVQNIAAIINKVIGVLLFVIGCVQLVKYMLG
ncbi:LysE family transporter [Kordia sp. YSTF-M3]|uniref:LysE family transporter n=1 Tax=Kordia aestuariivivens TaxID=2759037 RepID=A0ABR7Q3L4_9FLAO|nr:LysE family transporter [Kordia aestuariivivens]MBC8753147.1 LysE family transporter [Kordia aestuariivivens]